MAAREYDGSMTGQGTTPLLDTIGKPADIRRLRADQLRQLADELRQETISAVSVTGGHLGAGLCVGEVKGAPDYVFATPLDRLVRGVRPPPLPHPIVPPRVSPATPLAHDVLALGLSAPH